MGRSESRLADLDHAAAAWVGTPWADDSAVRGRGACCHRLVAAIYAEAGWLPPMPVPGGPALAAAWRDQSPMLDWFLSDGREWFHQVPVDTLSAGDAVLIRVRRIPYHLAILLGGQRLVHVTHEHGVRIIQASPAWIRHVDHVFRPIEIV